ncbi:hypothetical protein V4F39_01375 [Aquincola sp. MAHUQ-54]|uniref:Uncharacterized protein n=1 Tax=Aquincola agrisoli TaxID=3119538 RepID=A0AAW9Q580_9BURK
MFQTLKRWLSRRTERPAWSAVADWAESAGHSFKRTREGGGFVIEPAAASQGWRLEWGPSQRGYIEGNELRLRGDLKGGEELQMLVISRRLMEALEKQVFEQFTEGLQTRMDAETPEEMRWLVLFPAQPAYASKALQEGFGAVGSSLAAVEQWLSGPLSARLVEARRQWLAEDDPFVLIALRGRLTLRARMAEPDAELVRALVQLFDTALREGRRAAASWTAADEASTPPGDWTGAPLDSRLDGSPTR